MSLDTEDLLQRIHGLSEKIRHLGGQTVRGDHKAQALYAERCLNALAVSIIQERPVFHVEAWHPLYRNLALDNAGEMLLRLKDINGEPLAPYPAVMTFYGNGLTEELDTILCLCALNQFRQQRAEKQVSINISCRSLKNPEFVKAVLAKLGRMNLLFGEKIILEIHESNAAVSIDSTVISQFRKFGVAFAMDDVGVSMSDIFRLSVFKDVADFIKLDRSVVTNSSDPGALKTVLATARASLPQALVVAEGIQNVEHARLILNLHPEIKYIQGMYLPERLEFSKQWKQ